MIKSRFISAVAILGSLLLLSTRLIPQEQSITKKDVPKAVLAAFEKFFPKAHLKGFSKEMDEGRTLFEIESVEGKVNRDVTYTADGTLVSVEETVPVSEFPNSVRTALAKDFPKARISKSEKITKGQTVQYEVVLAVGEKHFEVVYDSSGKVVEKEETKGGGD